VAARRESEPLVKVTLNLYARDYERIGALYPELGQARFLRALLRTHLNRVDRRAAELRTELVSEVPIEISEEELFSE